MKSLFRTDAPERSYPEAQQTGNSLACFLPSQER